MEEDLERAINRNMAKEKLKSVVGSAELKAMLMYC